MDVSTKKKNKEAVGFRDRVIPGVHISGRTNVLFWKPILKAICTKKLNPGKNRIKRDVQITDIFRGIFKTVRKGRDRVCLCFRSTLPRDMGSIRGGTFFFRILGGGKNPPKKCQKGGEFPSQRESAGVLRESL